MTAHHQHEWTVYPFCGAQGGGHFDCDIPHEWLRDNTGHSEGDKAFIRVRANNQFGWGATSKHYWKRVISAPKQIRNFSLASNFKKIAWGRCGAYGCKYDIKALSVNPHRWIVQDLSGLSFDLPSMFHDQHHQFEVIAHNECGDVHACNPSVPPPTFADECPVTATLYPLVDGCSKNKD